MFDLRKMSGLAASLLLISAVAAHGAAITSLVTTADEDPEDDGAIVSSITTATATYTLLTPGDGVDPDGSNSRFWAEFGTDPGSRDAAVTDLDLTTGVFNPGSGVIHQLTVSAGDMIYLFGGQDNPNAITAVDAAGAAISDPLALGDWADLLDVTVNNNGDTGFIITRSVGGVIIAVDDFVFTDGNDVSDYAGFTVSNSNWDPIDFGLAAVPEPATLALMGIGAVMMLKRKH